MIVAREVLDEIIRNRIMRLTERQTLYLSVNDKHNIPISIVADICANRKDISEVSDFIAFAILESLDGKQLKYYFTDEEIGTYSQFKYEEKKIELPIVFEEMVQIADDQWIGEITVKRLMEFKDAQLIKYNENTQRTLRKIIKGENKYYKIFLNKKAIAEIKESLVNNTYISNVITLNIPPESLEVVKKKRTNRICTLVVSSIMDILDGYHRYISMSEIVREDPTFDYPMMIQIVSFSEEKARQFIFQEDQKTQMKKVDSAAMNQYNPANTTVAKLNSDPNSNLRGEIVKTTGKIDPSFLAALVFSYYFSQPGKKYTTKETLDITNDLEAKFNQLTSENTDWLSHQFSERDLQVIMFCFANGISDDATIRQMIEAAKPIDSKHFNLTNTSKVKRKLINELTARLNDIRKESG